MKHVLFLMIGFCLLHPCFVAALCPQNTPNSPPTMQLSESEQLIRQWETQLARGDLSLEERLDSLLKLATTYQSIGFTRKAQTILETAFPLAEKDVLRQIKLLIAASDLALMTRDYQKAREYAEDSLKRLPAEAPLALKAAVYNNLGNIMTVDAYYVEAVQNYNKGLELSKEANNSLLTVRLLTNRAQAHFKANQWEAATNSLQMASKELELLPDDAVKIFALAGIGEIAQKVQRNHNSTLVEVDKELRTLALGTLNAALDKATKLQHSRLQSYTLGFLGQLYENDNRYSEAQQLTRKAVFFAQQTHANDLLYRWQWQLGRLFKAQQQLDSAIESYRQAVKTLQSIRQEFAEGGYRSTAQSFSETISPVFFELADLLLQKAMTAKDKQSWLIEARDTVEQLKTAELQDYLQDDCVAPPKPLTLEGENMARVAIIYPILLTNRMEILLDSKEGLQQFTSDVTASRLKETANEFRFELESSDTDDFLGYAQTLYQWLIRPLESTLTARKIETLIIVPDGVLRTIPFSVLHDGKQFLVEKYATVVTPGMNLTMPSALQQDKTNRKILISALSKAVQGFPPLNSVPEEVRFIANLYAEDATLLVNEQFTVDNFSRLLNKTPYSIVHIASHGQFDGDPRKTFLLAYNSKVTMEQLEKWAHLSDRRSEPIELLTLSACQTAVGDEQAALGLAGVAIKAGVQNALATLWSVDDQATTLLISEFYKQTRQNNVSKAKALQRAQQTLLRRSTHKHPAFWAAFLLIGNGL